MMEKNQIYNAYIIGSFCVDYKDGTKIIVNIEEYNNAVEKNTGVFCSLGQYEGCICLHPSQIKLF